MSNQNYYSQTHIFTSRAADEQIYIRAGDNKSLIIQDYNLLEKSTFFVTGYSAQSIPTTTPTKLTSYWNGTPLIIGTDFTFNAGEVSVASSGVYYITYSIVFGINPSEDRLGYISVNGTGKYGYSDLKAQTDNARTGINGAATIRLSTNDVISIYAEQTSGSTIAMIATNNNIGTFSIVKII